MKRQNHFLVHALCVLNLTISYAQSMLPPVIKWTGKSEALIAQPGNPWITASEKASFETCNEWRLLPFHSWRYYFCCNRCTQISSLPKNRRRSEWKFRFHFAKKTIKYVEKQFKR